MLSTQELDIDFLQPCDHEEADTRVFLHLKHAVLQGHKVVFIRTVDTDLVVLAISVFDSLKELGLPELYIRYGVGKQRRDIPIQDVCYQLGPRECQALGMFHANSGSDFSSFKRGIGKKTAWSAWKAMPEMTDAFIKATEMPGDFSMESPLMACFEQPTCSSPRVNAPFLFVRILRRKTKFICELQLFVKPNHLVADKRFLQLRSLVI